LVQNKGDAHGAWRVFVGDQKVAANMELAIVLFVKTRRLFNVLVHGVLRNGQAVILFNPTLFVKRWGLQVHPTGLEFGEFFKGFNFLLKQTATGQTENIEHGNPLQSR
jgi:hypothetical protein